MLLSVIRFPFVSDSTNNTKIHLDGRKNNKKNLGVRVARKMGKNRQRFRDLSGLVPIDLNQFFLSLLISLPFTQSLESTGTIPSNITDKSRNLQMDKCQCANPADLDLVGLFTDLVLFVKGKPKEKLNSF